MRNKLIVVAVSLAAFSAVAFASGPMHFFDDVESGSGVWYEEAVYNLLNKGVFAANDNFNPGDLVDRAQMAVMFDRLYNAIDAPKGNYWDWDTYSNDYYTVGYPTKYLLGLMDNGGDLEFYAEYDDNGDCNSTLSGVGDYTWAITCIDLDDDETVMDVIDDFVGLYYDDTNVSIDAVDFNDETVYQVIMVDDTGYWSEYVFMADDERAYRFFGASEPYDQDFARYWRSFMLKD
jgi:hypothetical protein